ncbi:helix-turn-helix domain-containing protein [Bradyrhizobium sp. BRP22]|uniref:IclR family transcriptional regulator domain-containing protein n=1 Tax=Bradyrhizobium sp. BRP22 TaxID=2793821 RepID=UPI001CD3E904|nr:IclR family transcriptional regulator C-terminal domain-containing protein [Bradyrhizobium sp. BRP22]MCA1454648.1 helix-turn-helix domain-containing protein [Bradyrhizobium sp. BRP22]
MFEYRTNTLFSNTLSRSKSAVKANPAMATAEPKEKREGMAGLAKGLAIIEAFSVHPVMSVADAARASGATRAAARRCLLTLVELNYLELSGRDFRPLPRLRRLGGVISERERLAQVAQPLLERARDEVSESVSLAVLDNDQSLFIARAEAQHYVQTGVRVGAYLPLYCSATGRILLGRHTDDDIARRLSRYPMIARAPRTLTKMPDILSAIKTAAKNGYAVIDEELAPGIRAMAVPVFGPNGDIVAAVSVSAASARVKVSDLRKRMLPVLLDCANRIAQPLKELR